MGLDIKNIESILISKVSAVAFAVIGLSLGAVAYLKFKVPVVTVTQREIKDSRNPSSMDREKRIARASTLINNKLYKSAEEILVLLQRDMPKNTYVLSMLSLTQKKRGQMDLAEASLRDAIALEPGQWIFHNNLANILFEKGNYAEALVSFDKAIELSPKNYKVLLSKGKIQELIGKFTDAKSTYTAALSSGQLDGGTSSAVKDRLKRLDVLAYIERGDR